MSLFSVLSFLGSYLYAAFCCFAGLQLATPERASARFVLFAAVLSLGLGPIMLSWLLTMTLGIAPGIGRGTCVVMVILELGCLAVAGLCRSETRKSIGCVFRILLPHLFGWRRRDALAATGAAGLFVAVGAIMVVALTTPLAGNDALEYAAAGQRVYHAMSAHVYPFAGQNPDESFYGPWSHAMGFVGLYVWSFLIQGQADTAGTAMLITPWFALCTALVLIHVMGGARRPLAAWCGLVVLCTPAYLFTTMQNHVDQLRLFCLLVAFVALDKTQREHSRYACSMIAGMACAGGIFVHSIGWLVCLLVTAVALLVVRGRLRTKASVCALIVIAGVVPNVGGVIGNLELFGSPIVDVGIVPLYEIPRLHWQAFLLETRGISSSLDRWWVGVLGGLTQLTIYGLAYWLFVAALFWRCWKVWSICLAERGVGRIIEFVTTLTYHRDGTLLIGVVAFEAAVVLSVILGMDTFIKNYRYLLTTLPLVVLFGFRVVGPQFLVLWSQRSRSRW